MKESVIQQIDNMVELIYSMDKAGLDSAFVNLLDALAEALGQEPPANEEELNHILLNLQNAYLKKDLVEMADVLLYQLKAFLSAEAE